MSSKAELCFINKGTEYIKIHERLVLTIAVRKEHDKYDRRKKVCTTRLSDIWSLICLLYELLAGEFYSIMKAGLSSSIYVFLLLGTARF